MVGSEGQPGGEPWLLLDIETPYETISSDLDSPTVFLIVIALGIISLRRGKRDHGYK